MAFNFISVSVYAAHDSIVVQWELSNDFLPGDYKFYIERSESPEGPWTVINHTPIIDSYIFTDLDTKRLSKENQLFYRVRAKFENQEVISDAHDLYRNLERHSYLIARDICRKEYLRLKKYVGVPVKIFKRKRRGIQCPVCVDALTKESTDSHCMTCFGTGLTGGYYPAIETYAEILPVQETKKLTELGFTENFVTIARLPNYPMVVRDDILVDVENNKRYNIMEIKPETLQTIPVSQTVGLREISPSDVEFIL